MALKSGYKMKKRDAEKLSHLYTAPDLNKLEKVLNLLCSFSHQ